VLAGETFAPFALVAGTILFFALLAWLYRRARLQAGTQEG
jgi:hypothetical protein